MAAHSDVSKDKRTVVVPAKEQEQILNRLKTLVGGCETILKKASTATKVCGLCLDGKARKVNAAGNCLACDGKHVVDDFERHKWAFEQVMGRIAPMAKSVEMRLEDNRDKEALAKQFAGIKDLKVVDKLLQDMEIAVKSDAGDGEGGEDNGDGD